jgi:putative tryptophan/tyrosine transport system substrate-binding protein
VRFNNKRRRENYQFRHTGQRIMAVWKKNWGANNVIFWTLWIITLIFEVLTLFPSETQPATKVPRIGVLLVGSPEGPGLKAFRQGLRDLGYIEGKNIAIEYRFTKGKPEEISGLAADLVHKKVDVIITSGTALAQAIQQATTTTPIVLVVTGDPVGTGLVASLARPGGNITGFSIMSPELSGKRLELLKEAAPKIERVGVLWDALVPDNILDFETTQLAARALGLKLQSLEVRGAEDLEGAFLVAVKQRLHALVVIGGGIINRYQKRIVAFEVENRLPAIHETLPFAEAGGLMAYGVNVPDLFRRSATYVDKILKGAKPADLPVQQPTKFEFVINLKTAKQIGLTIPPNVLARADKVIK